MNGGSRDRQIEFDEPRQTEKGVAFRVTVEDNFGRRELEWNRGTALEVTQVFGPEAGRDLLKQFGEPTQARMIMATNPSYVDRIPFYRETPSSAEERRVSYVEEPRYLGGVSRLVLDGQEMPEEEEGFIYTHETQSEEVEERWKIPDWLTWEAVRRNHTFQWLALFALAVSLANPQPILGFSLRTTLISWNLSPLVEMTDWVNLVRWYYVGRAPWQANPNPQPTKSPEARVAR